MTNGIPHRGIPFFVADDVRYNFSVYDVVRKGMPTSMRQGFDNEKYIELQAANIRKRIAQFGGKLYLEFGGKLFDDYHASRVLPGFEPDTKFRMLESLVDDVEIVIAINANHIEKGKTRGDLGIPYDEDVLRLIDVFRSRGFLVGSVVLTQYANQPAADAYRHRLEQLGVTCRLHYPIAGYPHDIERIVSDDGYGRNEYIETSRPLVVVTAPGPGSGKLATCLSQLYHEHQGFAVPVGVYFEAQKSQLAMIIVFGGLFLITFILYFIIQLTGFNVETLLDFYIENQLSLVCILCTFFVAFINYLSCKISLKLINKKEY